MPWLENGARVSVRSEAATVVAAGALAGETLQASWPSLPAATATKTPLAARLPIAVLSAPE